MKYRILHLALATFLLGGTLPSMAAPPLVNECDTNNPTHAPMFSGENNDMAGSFLAI